MQMNWEMGVAKTSNPFKCKAIKHICTPIVLEKKSNHHPFERKMLFNKQ